MRIADVRCFPVRRGLCLVKIESDDGQYGWGEAGPSAWGKELATQGIVTHFRELLIGRDPRDMGALWQEMFRKGSGLDGGRVEMAAVSAIRCSRSRRPRRGVFVQATGALRLFRCGENRDQRKN